MTAVIGTQQAGGADAISRLEFFKKLQAVTNKIHATDNVDEIMLDLPQDISNLFHCDRLTIYALSDGRDFIVSKVKTGLTSFTDLQLPVSEQSVAGFVALFKRTINIRDVYDEAELKVHSPGLHFLKEVDKRTGYRTREMLVAPLLSAQTGELLGVVQLINNRLGGPFNPIAEEALRELCATLAIAFSQRLKPVQRIRSKYEFLIADALLSAPEFELATRSARRQNIDLEHVLINEFQIKRSAVGDALGKFFGTPYTPYKPDRIKPLDLLKNMKRDYVELNRWLPIADGMEGLVILTTDPEQVKSARIVNNVFPRASVIYNVTTNAEFKQTIDQFFGIADDPTSVGDLLMGMGMDDGEDELSEVAATDISAAAENELVKLVNKIIVDAYRQGASDIHIEPSPGKGKTIIRFRKDGSLENYIEIPASYRNAILARIKIMCDLDISERRKPQDGKIKFKKYGPLDIELRVATIPSAGGVEDVVMRTCGRRTDSIGQTRCTSAQPCTSQRNR